MNKFMITTLVCTLLCCFGCGQSYKSKEIKSKDSFPDFLAGTWKSEQSTWQITITKDGKISSALHPLGEVIVKPNETVYVEMKDDSVSTYRGGDFIAEYTPETRNLSVEINVDEIHIKFVDEAIDGNTVDVFSGPVSEDGKWWYPQLISRFDYGPRFPQDEKDVLGALLTFKKVEPENQ